MNADPYRMGSAAVPDDVKWRLEYPRNPDECIAALDVARRIGVRSWTVVAEILRNQPARRTHPYYDRVHDAAEALSLKFWDEARINGEPRRHFRLAKEILCGNCFHWSLEGRVCDHCGLGTRALEVRDYRPDTAEADRAARYVTSLDNIGRIHDAKWRASAQWREWVNSDEYRERAQRRLERNEEARAEADRLSQRLAEVRQRLPRQNYEDDT